MIILLAKSQSCYLMQNRFFCERKITFMLLLAGWHRACWLHLQWRRKTISSEININLDTMVHPHTTGDSNHEPWHAIPPKRQCG